MGSEPRTCAYRYGLRPPTTGADLVREQLRLAHDYYNAKIEIARGVREALAGVRIPSCPATVLVTEVEGAPKVRRYAPAVPAWHRVFFAVADGVHRGLARDTSLQNQRWINQAWSERGLHWGTRACVDKAVELAVEKRAKLGLPPRFRSWDGTGTIGTQLIEDVTSWTQDTRVRIMPVIDRRARTGRRGRRPGDGFAELWLRVGSDGRTPVWAVWPMRFDRPLPAGARARWVTVTLRREGTREVWSCSITVDEPAKAQRTGERAVAVDVRWRQVDGEQCCAYLRDTDGYEWSVDLPSDLPTRVRYADALRSAGDTHFDTHRDRLADWIGERTDLPEWLVAHARGMRLWRRRHRMRALYFVWSASRFAGDAEGWAIIEAWWRGLAWTPESRRQGGEYHLSDWEAAQRRKALYHRRDVYRCLAKQLARDYDHVIVEKFDKRAFAAAKDGEPPEDHSKRIAQRRSAPSEIVAAIKNAVPREGGQVHVVDCAGTTIDCHACGHRDSWDPGQTLTHTCSACGAHWDQRANAVRNLLARWQRERSGNERPPPTGSRARTGRWQRRKQARSHVLRQGQESLGANGRAAGKAS